MLQRLCAPQLGPTLDPCNPLEYIPSNTLTTIAMVLYLFAGLCHVFSIWKWGARWMSVMVIGIFTFSLGLAARLRLHDYMDSEGIYIVQYLLIVRSPCAFIAADYVLLGHLAIHLDATEHLIITPRHIMPIFISSDLTTFTVQAMGAAVLLATHNIKTMQTGMNILVAGLVLQLFSFFIFTLISLRFIYRVKTIRPEVWRRDALRNVPWYKDWRALAFALFISCVAILVRSVFRVVELSQGFKGPLATNESLFYGLDTLPIFIAVSIFVPFWPGRFIPQTTNKGKTSMPRDSDSANSKQEVERPSLLVF